MRIENSFIPVRGVGEGTERTLWTSGVTTWDAFDGTGVGETLAERIAGFIEVARARLDEGDARFFRDAFPTGEHWRLYEDFRAETGFLDIETTGLAPARDDVTTVSVHVDGETTTLVRGRTLTRDALVAALGGVTMLATFNGKRFDVPFLERAFDLSIDLPHLDLMYPCRRLDLTGGLKRIEREVGIERDRPDLDGADAVRLWREYQRGDDRALDTLVAYNRADVVNLEALADLVTGTLHETVFESARGT